MSNHGWPAYGERSKKSLSVYRCQRQLASPALYISAEFFASSSVDRTQFPRAIGSSGGMVELISPRSCRRMMFRSAQLSGVAMSGTSSPPPDKRPERSVLLGGPRRLSGPPDRRKDRFLAVAFTAAVHAIVFVALFWPRTTRPPSHTVPPPPLQVSLLETPKPTPPGPPEPVMLQPASVDVAPPHLAMRAPTPSAFTVPGTSDLLSNAQLAGAATVGEGGGGGGGTCDMARAVQQALRRDPMVREAVEEAHRSGKAIMIWNGDWVRNGDQDGKGLSAVREAIMWEVGFAPAVCRNLPMHGLVLLSLADGGTRFALGSNDWRWSDLLGLRH
jgi:hypothetical protein